MRYRELRFESRDEWLEARNNGIGGSDAGAVMGLNPYRSPLEVWLEKTGKVEPKDLSDKEAVEWGTRLEPMVAQKFADNHPELKVLRKNATMVSVDRPWAFANIDRELRGDGRGVLECKTAGLRSADQWVYGPPEHYIAQIQHYLSVTGWDFAWCAVLIGGQEYREFYIPRDAEDIAAIDKAVDAFWNEYVVKNVMPKMTGMRSESGALAGMYASPSDEYLSVMDADMPELGEISDLKRQIKALEERKSKAENIVKAAIGEAKGIESESVRATWVRSTQMTFDRKRFEADHPDLADEYTERKPKDGGLRLSPAKG